MPLSIRVQDTHSGQVLFECAPEDADKAYQKAAEFEALGLEVSLSHPTVNQTLADSLGVKDAPLKAFQDSLAEELEDHPGSCCFKDDDSESTARLQ